MVVIFKQLKKKGWKKKQCSVVIVLTLFRLKNISFNFYKTQPPPFHFYMVYGAPADIKPLKYNFSFEFLQEITYKP